MSSYTWLGLLQHIGCLLRAVYARLFGRLSAEFQASKFWKLDGYWIGAELGTVETTSCVPALSSPLTICATQRGPSVQYYKSTVLADEHGSTVSYLNNAFSLDLMSECESSINSTDIRGVRRTGIGNLALLQLTRTDKVDNRQNASVTNRGNGLPT